MNRALSWIRTGAALTAVAIAVAGCAAANNATSAQASAPGEQPYKTAYGMTSDGPTTDLYTELFGPRQPAAAPAPNVASAQPVQPVTAQPVTPVQQVQQYSTAQQYPTPRQGQAAATTTPGRPGQTQTTVASRAPQPAYSQPAPVQGAPVQVAQQPAAPAPPPEPDVPTAYGITTNGPTTDLFTEIFGPRRSNGQ